MKGTTKANAGYSSVEQQARQFLGQLERQAQRTTEERTLQNQVNAATYEAYRWGQRSKRDFHFQPNQRSADAAIYESQDLMHRRVRSEKCNNAQTNRIVNSFMDLVVGGGIQTFADPFDPLMDLTALESEELDRCLHYALEADQRYEDWWLNKDQFDVSRKLNGPAMQRLAMSELVEVGEVFILKCQLTRPDTPIRLCYQILEKDQLDRTKDRPGGTNENKIINGIEIDTLGCEVAFWVYDAHPYDSFTGAGLVGKSRRIPADRMIHLYLAERPSQSVGVTWLHSIGQNSFDRDKFMSSELQTAAKAALLLLVRYAKNLSSAGNMGLDDGEDSDDQYGNEQIKLGSTPMAMVVGAEDKLELLEAARPNANAESFLSLLDHGNAAGVGLSWYQLTGDYSATNFSSVRAAKLDEDMHIRPIQNWIGYDLALPIRREFHREAIARGLIKSVSPSDYLANTERYSRFDAMGPGRELLAPGEETDAAAARCRSGLSNLKLENGRRGNHWIRVLRQMAIENHLKQLLGVVVDFSKGQGGQVTDSTSAASGSNEPTPEPKKKQTTTTVPQKTKGGR